MVTSVPLMGVVAPLPCTWLIGVSGALHATGTGVGSGVGEGVGVTLLIGSPRTVTISKRSVPFVP